MLSAGARGSMCRKVRSGLGIVHFTPIMNVMDEQEETKGFQFPGVFEITAMGPASAALETVIPRELEAAGITVMHESVRSRASSGGRYVSISISFLAASREQYDAAHVALRAHPEVKWTL